jgi:UDP-glucose 4,6-dehydratase
MNKSILVTGGLGFIGSNFINYLLENTNYTIVNVDKYSQCSSYKNIVYKSNNYFYYKSNINNIEFINHILNTHNITIVYHFSAQSHVDNSFNDVYGFINDNIIGTYTLLECCRKYNKIEKFIHVSTDEVYGEITHNDVVNENEYNPTNPYSATKASAELLVKSYMTSFKLPVIITRSNNIFGINQYPEKVIPKFILKINNNEKCPIYGTGSALRKYLYIGDACKAFYLILENGEIGKIYQMGSSHEYSTIDILKLIVSIMKPNESHENYIDYVSDRNYHDCRYVVNDKTLVDLGFKIDNTHETFLNNLKYTIEWYINNINHWL